MIAFSQSVTDQVVGNLWRRDADGRAYPYLEGFRSR